MTKSLVSSQELPSRLNLGGWVGLKPGFPWTQKKDHLVKEFIFQKSEGGFERSSFPDPMGALSLSFLTFTLKGPLTGASGTPWPPAVQHYPLTFPQVTQPGRDQKEHLTRVPPSGPNWTPTCVTNSGDITTTQAALGGFDFERSLQCQLHLTSEGTIFWEFHLVVQLPSSPRRRGFPTLMLPKLCCVSSKHLAPVVKECGKLIPNPSSDF